MTGTLRRVSDVPTRHYVVDPELYNRRRNSHYVPMSQPPDPSAQNSMEHYNIYSAVQSLCDAMNSPRRSYNTIDDADFVQTLEGQSKSKCLSSWELLIQSHRI